MVVRIASHNSQGGGLPGHDRYMEENWQRFDLWAFQEVHARKSKFYLQKYWMPENPGARVYKPNLDLAAELSWRATCLGYLPIFAPHLEGFHDLEPREGIFFGQLTAVCQRTFELVAYRNEFVYGQSNQFNTEESGGTPCGKVATGVLLRHRASGRELVVVNVHGFWSKYGKRDLPSRLLQNRGINSLAQKLLRLGMNAEVLVIGDLNYRSGLKCLLDLQCQPCFGGAGVNLNHCFGISRTRTNHYRRWQEEPEADFAVASPGLAAQVTGMAVDLSTPSDHATISVDINW